MSEEKKVLPTFPDLHAEFALGDESRAEFYNALQEQVYAWAEYNFGEGTGLAHRQILGMIEELGELDEELVSLEQVDETVSAFVKGMPTTDFDKKHREWLNVSAARHAEAALDACADFIVYAAHYCAKRGWRLGDLSRRAVTKEIDQDVMAVARWLAHAQLKGEQGIRGGFAAKDQVLQEAIGVGMRLARSACAKRLPMSLEAAVQRTWYVVRKRDWVNFPSTAATEAEKEAQ